MVHSNDSDKSLTVAHIISKDTEKTLECKRSKLSSYFENVKDKLTNSEFELAILTFKQTDEKIDQVCYDLMNSTRLVKKHFIYLFV